MFVLRSARELMASLLGVELERVAPETALSEHAAALLGGLFEQIGELLLGEQIVNDLNEMSSVTPRAEELAGDDVAAAADLVTRAAVKLLIASRLDVDPTELSTELNFAVDLGADSLTRVDLVLLLEETLEVSVPDDSMFLVQSVGDAELFSVLFDRTREKVVMELGEAARDLTFDTPLERYGEQASTIAKEAAGQAVGPAISLPDCECKTLKDAVRLAFLTEKLRRAFSKAAQVGVDRITMDTIPERDLGLDAAQTKQILDNLTVSMDLGPAPIQGGHKATFDQTLQAFVSVPELGDGGVRR